jgi:hypothetical protein
LDTDQSSKIRALTLASRCLAREIRRIAELPAEDASRGHETLEIERVVDLARTILDPSYVSPDSPGPNGSSPRAPLPSRRGASANIDALPDLVGDGPPSPHHVLALLGRGTFLPIPELVGFLGTLQATGILRVATGTEEFLVEFDTGQIAHAEGTRSPSGQRLGDLLVAQGAVERSTLEEIYTGGATWKLGRSLLRHKHITLEQLVRALQTQIQLLFCRLFREEVKSFTFWCGPILCGEQGVRLNATSLLLESARVQDEANDDLRALGEKRQEDSEKRPEDDEWADFAGS